MEGFKHGQIFYIIFSYFPKGKFDFNISFKWSKEGHECGRYLKGKYGGKGKNKDCSPDQYKFYILPEAKWGRCSLFTGGGYFIKSRAKLKCGSNKSERSYLQLDYRDGKCGYYEKNTNKLTSLIKKHKFVKVHESHCEKPFRIPKAISRYQ